MEFELHPAAVSSIDALAEEARQAIQPLRDVQDMSTSASSHWGPPPQVTITGRDLLNDPVAWLTTIDGKEAWAFAWKNGACLGIVEEKYGVIDRLIDALVKVRWVKSTVSDEYIRRAFVGWAREALNSDVRTSFVDNFLQGVRGDVREQDVSSRCAISPD